MIEEIEKIATILRGGGVVALDTDTVPGLLTDSTNSKAVEKVYKLKQREKKKTLAVFVSSMQQAHDLCEIPSYFETTFLEKYWPGALTIVAKHKSKAPQLSEDCYKNGKIALRMPASKFLLKLCEQYPHPIAATSANISGQDIITNNKDMSKLLNSKDSSIDYIDLKNCYDGKSASNIIEVIDSHSYKILRASHNFKQEILQL